MYIFYQTQNFKHFNHEEFRSLLSSHLIHNIRNIEDKSHLPILSLIKEVIGISKAGVPLPDYLMV